jgi:DNA-binding NarL/FixJ family response regulator
MSEKVIRVILADDHELVLEGLKGLIEQKSDMQVVATANSGDELLEILKTHEADVVVMDIQMPYSGLKALAEIRQQKLAVHILILTAFSDGDSIQTALELEAEGFALKTESPTQTIEAIRQVAQGRLVFPRAAQRWLLGQRKSQHEADNRLSPREMEVLEFAARGKTNPEIAEELNVSENTVRFHMKNIFEKLGVTNRTEAAAWYFQNHGK